MHPLLKDNLVKVGQLCEKHRVRSLFAFGSVCTDAFDEASDVDLLVSFLPMDYSDYADAYYDLANALEAVFDRPVDLLTDKSLRNPYFLETVNKTKTLIYGN